jgi:hypothetical protein
MKLSSSFVVVCVGLVANAIYVVQAETMLRMILNNGITDPSMSCTAVDNILISKVFDRPLNRRNLRSSTTLNQAVDRPIDYIQEIEHSNDNEEDRELQQSSAATCKRECEGIASGYCYKTGCTWYNKNRKLQNYGKGFLSNSTFCRTTADSINSDLEYLVTQSLVSTSCIALLQAPRKIECYEDVMYGIIDAFRVIDADTDTKIISFLDARQTICNINAFNFQVSVNPCVNSVNITLYNRKENYYVSVVRDTTMPGPHTLFGMVGTSTKNYNGESIPLGNFTIEATPDGNTNKTRVRNFFIEQC